MSCKIHLTRNQVAIIDEEDFERIDVKKWYASEQGSECRYYAVRGTYIKNGGQRTYKKYWMHREIMNCPPGMFVDHINGDGLDNRKENLRIVTWEENNRKALEKGWYNRVRVKPTEDATL